MSDKRVFFAAGHLPQLAICVRFGADVATRPARLALALERLSHLRRRFACPLLIGASAPEPLGVARATGWLLDGSVAQLVYSGAEEYLSHDLATAAIRSPYPSLVFVDAGDLVARFAALLKFVTSCVGLDLPWRQSGCGRMLFCDRAVLRSGEMAAAQAEWSAAVGVSVDGARHLFASAAGVARFGGFDAFVAKGLALGGTPVASFDRYWLLGEGGAPAGDGRATALAAVHGEGARRVVFDINPAALPAGAPAGAGAAVQVPRQVLHARAFEGTFAAPPLREALFVVSNYNKRKYLQAALYSLMMQTWPRVRVELVDDGSSDGSMDAARSFAALLEAPESLLELRCNTVNRGTYWIRNDVIRRHRQDDTVYFINDSDDCSSSQRVALQLAALGADGLGCFFDIVRVDDGWRLLPLNEEVERYGTASLCFTATTVREYGFFQTLRKNADTEFIERVKAFGGKDALPWRRYPVLFQPFDGQNLTADIYQMNSATGALSHMHGTRAMHTEAFRKHHARLDKAVLPDAFPFPLSHLPREYSRLARDFIVRGYEGVDACMLVLRADPGEAVCRRLLGKGFRLLLPFANDGWQLAAPGSAPFLTDQGLQAVFGWARETLEFSGYLVVDDSAADAASAAAWLAGPAMAGRLQLSKSEGDQHAYGVDLRRLPAPEAIALIDSLRRPGATMQGTLLSVNLLSLLEARVP